MPPDRVFIQRVVAEVQRALAFLRGKAALSEAEFLASEDARYSSAYALLMAMEGLCSVANHLVAAGGHPVPRGTPEAFPVLQRAGVISDPELAVRLSKMARFRNLLVHRYWDLDYSLVFAFLQNDLGDFDRFWAEVDRFLG